MKTLKQSIKQYRNIGGKYFLCYSSDPSTFADDKKMAKRQGKKTRIINGQLYIEQTN